jgi:catechol 2,3-dioxygenase-like lactoylglutathione lyase family enzyme
MTNVQGAKLPVVEIPTCCGTPSTPPAGETKFHFALNVSNLQRSIDFYRVLFGVPPAKQYGDYAKFELSQPPLVFSLMPNPPGSGGSLSHFGLPVANSEDVQAAADRLAAAGLQISCQQGTVCGYARQDKVWVADPDRNFWEIYVVHEDVDPETVRVSFDGIAPPIDSAPPPQHIEQSAIVWEHRILMPLPTRISYDDATVEEVRLVGTFNDDFSDSQRAQLLAEAKRVLRPAGTLSVHGLVASQPLSELPTLPGVAGLVRRVPFEPEPLREISRAGFESVRVTKLPEAAAFRHGAVEMREIKLEARKPEAEAPLSSQDRVVLYKGPFANVIDEDGLTFCRGKRTPVTQRTWDKLAAGAAAPQFVFFGGPCAEECGCG